MPLVVVGNHVHTEKKIFIEEQKRADGVGERWRERNN